MLEEAHLLKNLCPNASLFWLDGTLSTVKPTRQLSHRILLEAEKGNKRGNKRNGKKGEKRRTRRTETER
jgi:hypothetical protein